MTWSYSEQPTSAGELVNALVEDFIEQTRLGSAPSIAEFVGAHPEQAAELTEILETLQVVNQLSQTDSQSSDFPEIEDYQLLRIAGRGGMGVVYEAIQESLNRRVALKVLPPFKYADTNARERFQFEAKTAAQLHHTNIVPVFEVSLHGDVHYYTMQFIDGQSLDVIVSQLRMLGGSSFNGGLPSTRVQSKPGSTSHALNALIDTENASKSVLSAQQVTRKGQFFLNVARVGRQAAQGLQHAHDHGIVHRDIKPSNLMLDTRANCWIADFGLAKTEEQNLTQAGDVVGTLRYMAPERFSGQCDARSDVYSLGATLYELVAWRAPFESHDRLRLIDEIRNRRPLDLRIAVRTTPSDLQTIINKAMAPDPNSRYSTAQEFADDLYRFQSGEAIRARRVGALERLSLWSNKNRGMATALATVALLLTIGSLTSTWAAFHFRTQERRQAQLVVEKTEALQQAGEAEAAALNSAGNAKLSAAQARREANIADALTGFFQEQILTSRFLSDLNSVQLDRLLQLVDERTNMSGEVEAGLRRRIGLDLEYKGKTLRALTQLQRALKLQQQEFGHHARDTLSTMHHIANCHLDLGDLDQAIPIYEQTLKLQREHLGEDHVDVYWTEGNLGWAMLRSGQATTGLALLEDAVIKMHMLSGTFGFSARVFDPKLLSAYAETKQTVKQENLRKKQAIYQQFKNRPDYELLLAWAQSLLADPHVEKSAALEAQASAKQAMDANPADSEILFTLALADFRLGNIDEALALLEGAIDTQEKNVVPNAGVVRSLCLSRLGQIEAARHALNKSIDQLAQSTKRVPENVMRLAHEAAFNSWAVPSQNEVRVTTLADQLNGIADGEISLREALCLVDENGTIEFDLVGQIDLTLGPLLVQRSVTIQGPGQDQLVISGQDRSRIMLIDDYRVDHQANAHLVGLRLTNGAAEANGQTVYHWGGAVNSQESLTLSDCLLDRNFGGYSGGAVMAWGPAVVSFARCTFLENSATTGGAVRINLDVIATTFDSCLWESNRATGGDGSAIHVRGTAGRVDIRNSTFVANNAWINDDAAPPNLEDYWRLGALKAGSLANEDSLSEKESYGVEILRRICPSGDANKAVFVTFKNDLEYDVQLSWVNNDGTPRNYATIKAGESREQNTYASHVWFAKDADGKSIAVFRITKTDALAIIDSRTLQAVANQRSSASTLSTCCESTNIQHCTFSRNQGSAIRGYVDKVFAIPQNGPL